MKYKVGDRVIITNNYYQDRACTLVRTKIPIKNKIGKIIAKTRYISQYYHRIKIEKCPYKNECKKLEKLRYCVFMGENEIKSLDSLKLKKLIKHGV